MQLTKLWPVLALMLAPTALAHTQITSMEPAAGSTASAPKQVILRFNEPVNLRYSIFKVYPMPAGQTGNRAANSLARQVIRQRGDEAARADLYQPKNSHSAGVSLPLKAGLNSGEYVVMWQLLSADGHPVSGQATFKVR